MPTPYGSRGGMAFGTEELRVLRRALALALHPSPVSDADVQDCLRLADAVDEAVNDRAALPGTATGYLALLDDVLASGYQPGADDLAALRALRGNPVAAALLDRCRTVAEQAVRARLSGRSHTSAASAPAPRPLVPASRTRLLALPGGRSEGDERTAPKPGKPSAPPVKPAAPDSPRPVPTPAEVFPPKRRPTDPPHQLAAG